MSRIEIKLGDTVYAVKSFQFPGGERQVSVPGIPDGMSGASVLARVQSPEDAIDLMLVSEVVRRRCVGPVTLTIPYFPYARQDRIMDDTTEAFSLRAFAGLVNGLGYSRVRTYDPHSDVTAALVPNLQVVRQCNALIGFWEACAAAQNSGAIVSPDAGAAKKAGAIALALKRPLIVATKSRDTTTGALSGFRVMEDTVPESVFIVDDICDGGRTFIELAKALRDKGAKKVGLFVTHGIFSKGLAVFDGLIDTIYTTDTFVSPATFDPPQNLFIKKVGGH